MMMTEQEARGKWCPFARDNNGNRLAFGGPGDDPAFDEYATEMSAIHPCIASSCMAWRWDVMAGDTDNDGKVTFADYDKGYCGLAGRPAP